MRIACPNCQTLYDVPDNLFGGRPRRLRCEHCGHGWRVTAEGLPEDAAQEHDAPAPAVNEALNRRFGEPVDDEAKAEVQAALQDEVQGHPHAADATPPLVAGEATAPDRFADLLHAARNNGMELETGTSSRKPGRRGNPLLVTLLVVLLVLALTVLERHTVMRLLPVSAKFFQALHLS